MFGVFGAFGVSGVSGVSGVLGAFVVSGVLGVDTGGRCRVRAPWRAYPGPRGPLRRMAGTGGVSRPVAVAAAYARLLCLPGTKRQAFLIGAVALWLAVPVPGAVLRPATAAAQLDGPGPRAPVALAVPAGAGAPAAPAAAPAAPAA